MIIRNLSLQYSGIILLILCVIMIGCTSPVQPVAPTKSFSTDTPTLIVMSATITPPNEHQKIATTPIPTPLPTMAREMTIEVDAIQGDAQEQIAEALFRAWLEHYKINPGDPQTRLLDYTIEQVEIPEMWQYCAPFLKVDFIASIVYSVQPVTNPPARWAESGHLSRTDNWITNKHNDIAVRKMGTAYHMELLGAPVCPVSPSLDSTKPG